MGGSGDEFASETLSLPFPIPDCSRMLSPWDKIQSLLDMMDMEDRYSLHPVSSPFSSESSSSESFRHPFFVDARSWMVVDETIEQILAVIQPTTDSEIRRGLIIDYLQQLVEATFGIKVYVCGSVPLKTYLPHGDVDLTALSTTVSCDKLAADFCSLLEYEEKNNANVPVRDVVSVPAQVKIVKCTVDSIPVDISFNQTGGLCALYFLEQVDRYVGKDHLFKFSIILIKAWCYYESRILGGFYGLIATYGLEIMVLHIINLFHSTLYCPLGVLYKFLEYYSTFDWDKYCIAINGLVLLSSLPKIEVVLLDDCDELLLTEQFLWSTRDPLLRSVGDDGNTNSVFTPKFLNILDPLKESNNLGRSVNQGNFYRIKRAFSYGFGKLRDIMMLPPENIRGGLEKFFKGTLEMNGKGKRVDVSFPVPLYASESIEYGNNDLLPSLEYGMWSDRDASYTVRPAIPAPRQMWLNARGDVSQNIQHNPSADYYLEGIQPYIDIPRAVVHPAAEEQLRMRGMVVLLDNPICQNNTGPLEENWNSRGVNRCGGRQMNNATYDEQMSSVGGTDAFIPNYERRKRFMPTYRGRRAEHERSKGREKMKNEKSANWGSQSSNPVESNISSDVGESSRSINYSMNEFPVLPRGKPISIRPPPLARTQGDEVKETPESSDSTKSGSCKFTSPTSVPLSEADKQSYSDVFVSLDAYTEPINAVAIPKDKNPSESQEKITLEKMNNNPSESMENSTQETMEESLQALNLTDESEFPPLIHPETPVITFSKKEFPPLRACLRSQKRNRGRR